MIKRTLVLILAGCLLLCIASFAEQEHDDTDVPGKIVYEDEYLTVRLGIIVQE